jgi:uncharacterized membrane protein
LPNKSLEAKYFKYKPIIIIIIIIIAIFFSQNKVVSLVSNPKPGEQGPCTYVPSDRVAQLYPQALGSLFAAF